MHTTKVGKKGKFLAMLAALAVVVAGAFSPLTPNAAADETTAKSWSELKQQINSASGSRTITLGQDFTWDGSTINIPAGKNITIYGDHTIYRAANATTLNSMFSVKGTLTFGGKVKISGKAATCTPGATPAVSGPHPGTKPAITEHSETQFWWEKHSSSEMYWNSSTNSSPVEGKRVMLGFRVANRADTTSGPGIGYIGSGQIVRIADESDVVEEEGYGTGRYQLKSTIDENKYVFRVTDVEHTYGGAWFNTLDGKYVLGRWGAEIGDLNPLVIVEKGSSDGHKIENDASTHNFKFQINVGDLVGRKYIIPNTRQSLAEADKQDYAVVGAYLQLIGSAEGYGTDGTYLWVEHEKTTPYWLVEGSNNHFATYEAANNYANDHTGQYWTVAGTNQRFESAAAANQWAQQHAAPATCTTTCSKITTAMFNGSSGNEKGYFVQVQQGGTFNLQGNAELRDFITGPNVSYVAPVVAKGGTVNIKGGKITNNSAGYNADDSKNQDSANVIEKYIEKSLTRTETAGAIMYLGGAKGSITSGVIENNRGDAGGIVVDGENTAVTMTGGEINKNVGIHYGGAAYVHLGGSFTMAGNAKMANNYAWDRGGAVYVSSQDYASSIVWPVIEPKQYKPATFVMDGENAVISGNYAVNRAGAVFVESHDVMLKSGQITGNFSRSLGGAIYVVGDGDARMYQLYVPNACVTGNTAVKGGTNAGPLNKALPNSTGDACTINNTLQSTGLLQGDNAAFRGHEGFGGGVWLCAFGGNATFGSGTDAQGNNANVVIAGNSAQPKQGADMHLRPTKPGAGSGINVLNNYTSDQWVNEVDQTPIVVNQVYTGPLNVKNNGSAQCSGSMKISGNYARVGGGIASDGTVVFGPAKDIYRVHGKLDVTKTWDNVPESQRKAIDLQLAVKEGNTTYPLEGYKIRLDGTADKYDNDNPIEENDGNYNNETPAWESTPWNGTFGLPLVYTDSSGNEKPVFTFKDPDNASRTLNPAEPEDLPRLYELVKAKRLGTGNLTASLTIIETINGQAPTEYVYTQKDVTFNVNSSATDSKTLAQKTYKDRAGNVIGVVNTNKIALNMHKDISNTVDEEVPAPEKYVNKKVHDNIVNFDQEFTYDVMAYVPVNATKITITDTLVEGLEFADVNGKPTKAALSTIQRIAYRSTNDHTPNGSVAADPEGTLSVSNQTVGIANGNKLVVTIDKATPLNKIKGKWVQVTFKARIKDNYRTIEALKAAGWSNTTDNKQGAIPGPDASLVEALNATIAPNYDTVARAIEGPSRLFALTQNGNYYATPMNDKSGKTWVAPSAGDDFTANAASRFNGTATNNVRELVLKATPSGQVANWPVQSGEAHEGMLNKATYIAYTPAHTGGSTYETNTVTVTPETTQLNVEKRWSVNGSTAWPSNVQNVTFGIFANGTKVREVELTSAEPSKTVTDLPKLKGVTYSAKEIAVNGTPVSGANDASANTGVVNGTGANPFSYVSKTTTETIQGMTRFVTTNEAPQVEKYVNNNVHAELEGFDEVFEYSVMAYVPNGATKVEITDTLTDDLVFVDLKGNAQKIKNDAGEIVDNPDFNANNLITNSSATGYDLIIEGSNDHKVNGTVKGHADNGWFVNHPEQHLNGPLHNNGVKLSTDGKTITVTVNEGELVANPANKRQIDAHGKWIVLSFRATINPASYATVQEQLGKGDDSAVAGLSWQKIEDDKTVTGGSKPHAGLDNTAKYKVYVGNEGSSDYETNTVTVKPGTTSVTATKTWLDKKGDPMTWPNEVASVTVKVLRSDTNAEVGTITLTKANPKGTLKDLPKLDGVTYTVEEVEIPGYVQYGTVTGSGTVDDPYVFNNQENGGPQIEKYINNGVHDNLDAGFDTSFKYDIIAYVPNNADEIVIKDTLVNALEFAKAPAGGTPSDDQTVAAEKSSDPDEVVTSIVVKDDNNHQVGTRPAQYPNATVLQPGDNVRSKATVAINGKELKVTFGSDSNPITAVDGLRGKYIQITFWAKYTPEMIAAAQSGDSKTITGNGAVIGGMASHTGTTNDASYDIRVGNTWEEDVKSNTVTIRGKDTQLEATKQWQNADGSAASWPSGVNEVKINVIKNGNKTDIVDTIKLNANSAIGKSKKLPVLVGVTYGLDEVAVPGYVTTRNGNTFVNKAVGEPQIEKYINKDVDAHLVEFDKSFTYDILAFVPLDADEIVIKDTLVKSLEFASTDVQVVAKGSNDHKANGTVSATNGTPLGTAAVPTFSADGRTLTVTVDNAEPYRGQWIQVTFTAQYTEETIKAAEVRDSDTINNNGAVISSIKTHDGTTNFASYDVRVGHDWTKDVKSNTVTHDAETTTVTAEKQWQNADGSTAEWPAGISEVTVKVINDATGNPVENADITLTPSKPKATSKVLPKLQGVTYSIKEVPINGYISAVEGNVVTNKDAGTPTIEKYINNGVHENLDKGFDTSFKYDIMVFVPDDADSLEINDALVDALEFAKAPADGKLSNEQTAAADHSTNPAEVVTGIVVKGTNDHTVRGTVADTSGTALGTAAVPTISADGRSLKVEIADATAYRGKWIQVTFWAKYTDEMIQSATVGNSATITNNGTVLGGMASHDGTTNDATYKIKVRNDWSSDYKSNTVTVKGKATQLGVEKKWNVNGSTAWPDDIATVTFGIFANDKLVWVNANGAIASPNGEGAYPAGAKELTVKLNENKTRDTVTGLPILVGVTYSAKEIAVNDVPVSVGNTGDNGYVLVDSAATNTIKFIAGTVKKTASGVDWYTTTNETPQIEKYINKDVDAHLVEFDRNFTYDILAYVPLGADSLEINDSLVESLEFAKADGTASIVPGEVVTSIVAKASNDHRVRGTVSAGGGTPLGAAAVPTISADGRSLKVEIAEATAYRGQWIQVTFKAKYTKQAIEAAEVANSQTITDNGSVLDGAARHDGTSNTASYKIKVGNAWTSDYDSNTVTHDAETTTVKAQKQWKHADGTYMTVWPKDSAGRPVEVTVKVINSKTNEEVDTITLTQANPQGTSKALPKLQGVTYKVDEVNVPAGFAKTVNGTTVVNTAQKYEVGFSKYEITKSDELEGARIKITGPDGFVEEWTSSANGPHFVELEAGEYTFEEVTAPDGYDKLTATINFTVDTDGNVTVTSATSNIGGKVTIGGDHLKNHFILEDVPRRVSVTVTKEWLNASGWTVAMPSHWPAGAEVTANIMDGTTVVATVVLNETNQSATVNDLPMLHGRQYTIEEVSVVGVYSLEGTPEIVTDADGDVTMKLTNRLLPRYSEMTIEVAKVNEKGEPLAGAELMLTGVDLDGNRVDLGSAAVWTTDGTNHIVDHVVPGTYTLTELSAPDGYQIADPITFEVTKEGVVTVNGQVLGTPVITMTDELTPGNGGGGDNKTPPPTVKSDNPRTKGLLVKTGSAVGIAMLVAFGLIGAGVGVLAARRLRH